jgi:hypothetical protein
VAVGIINDIKNKEHSHLDITNTTCGQTWARREVIQLRIYSASRSYVTGDNVIDRGQRLRNTQIVFNYLFGISAKNVKELLICWT